MGAALLLVLGIGVLDELEPHGQRRRWFPSIGTCEFRFIGRRRIRPDNTSAASVRCLQHTHHAARRDRAAPKAIPAEAMAVRRCPTRAAVSLSSATLTLTRYGDASAEPATGLPLLRENRNPREGCVGLRPFVSYVGFCALLQGASPAAPALAHMETLTVCVYLFYVFSSIFSLCFFM